MAARVPHKLHSSRERALASRAFPVPGLPRTLVLLRRRGFLFPLVLLYPLVLFCALALHPGTTHAAQWNDRSLIGSRILSPDFLGNEKLDEAWRRGDFDRSTSLLPPRDYAEATRRFPTLAQVLGSATAPARTAKDSIPLGFSAQSDLKILAFGANPPRQLEPIFLNVREGEAVDPAWRARLGFWLDSGLAKGLSAHLRFVFDGEGKNDTHNRTRDYTQLGASNNLDEAYLRYKTGRAAFTLGRRFLQWGPERLGSIVLSSTAPAPDLVQAEIDLGKHRLQAFAGQLSTELVDSTNYHRSLYGHRIDFSLGSFGRLGLSELAVVSDRAGGFDLKYLNPVSLYVVAQTEKGSSDQKTVNIFHSIDGEFWWKSWHPYGAFLVDDLQIDASARKKWPHQLALAIGVDRALGPRFLASYEYRRIGSWTYLHRGLGTDAQHFERPLGAPEGPDTDRHFLQLSYTATKNTRLWIAGEHWRRGVNRLSTEESREGHAGEPYPRPPLETRWVLEAGAQWELAQRARARLQLAWHSIDGVNNTTQNLEVVELRAYLQLFTPPLAWLLGG